MSLEVAASSVRIPNDSSTVWKEECVYSFQTQDDDRGILVDLNSWVAVSFDFVTLNYNLTKHPLYLNIKRTKVEKKQEVAPEDPNAPKVLGIGVEGGFAGEKEYDYTFEYALVLMPEQTIFPLPDATIPTPIQKAIDAVIKVGSAEKKQEIAKFVDDMQVTESELARSLEQLNTGRVLSPTGLTCDDCGGDGTTNLWLNLRDGHVGCGRRNFDGSGGNGHAIAHYNQTGNSIVVKLGTITAEGQADVYCYLEDKFVSDPHLQKHLSHWGLDMKKLTKTDKTVAELEIELQYTFDWAKGAEKNKELVPLYGPGFTGLENLGNTCYMASVMQVLFKIPAFIEHFVTRRDAIFQQDRDPAGSFYVQMAKLGHGLLSGEYSHPPTDDEHAKTWVKPLMFKTLVGRGHPEFSTNRQQDAFEYLQHLLSVLERSRKARGEQEDPTKGFTFNVEEKLQCTSSQQVSFKALTEQVLLLPIPIDQATNKVDVATYEAQQAAKSEDQKKREKETRTEPEPVRPLVPMVACFNAGFGVESVSNWYSPAIKQNTICLKKRSFASYPQFLVVQMARFAQEGLMVKKLDVFLDVPDVLDLGHLRSQGKQAGEQLMSNDPAPIKINEEVVNQLMQMGFPRINCEWAWFHNQNAGADAACEWLFAHMDDKFDKPVNAPAAQPQDSYGNPRKQTLTPFSGAQFDEMTIVTLCSMGFEKNHVVQALKATQGDAERAADWLFNHPEAPMEVEQQKPAAPRANEGIQNNEEGRYRLFAFVTHMGPNTGSGHYVSHINVDGKWVMFDDRHVKESQEEPRKLAYIYIYQKI